MQPGSNISNIMLEKLCDLKKLNWQTPHHHWVWWCYTCHTSFGCIQDKLFVTSLLPVLDLISLFSIFYSSCWSFLKFFSIRITKKEFCWCRYFLYFWLHWLGLPAVTVTMATVSCKYCEKESKTCKCFLPFIVKDSHELCYLQGSKLFC